MILKLNLQYFWPPHVKSWLIGKDPDSGRDWEYEEKGITEDETAGWHHRLDGHGFGWLRELVMDREAWPAVVRGVGHDWVTELSWPELKCFREKLKQGIWGGICPHRILPGYRAFTKCKYHPTTNLPPYAQEIIYVSYLAQEKRKHAKLETENWIMH